MMTGAVGNGTENGNALDDALKIRAYDLALAGRPSGYIMAIMELLEKEHPERQNNDTIAQIAALLEEEVGIGAGATGAIYFGEESVGGPLTVDKIKLFEADVKKVLGYKPVRSFAEAKARRKATAKHISLRGENQEKRSSDLEDDVRRLWGRAMLNPAPIEGAFPVDAHGKVKEHGGIITVYRGLGLGQTMLPQLNQEIDRGTELSNELRSATLEILMERLAFWRANPFTAKGRNIGVGDIPQTKDHYASKEIGFFRIANEVFSLGLEERDFTSISHYIDALNGRLVLDPSDLGLRMDLKWFNVGYDVENIRQPDISNVLHAVNGSSVGGIVNKNKLRDIIVNYDLDGSNVLVPRQHELSHIETDPLTRFEQDDPDIYLATVILNERMFDALRDKKYHLAIDLSNQIASLLGGHIAPGDLPEIKYHQTTTGKTNRPITNFYRSTEEAEQILSTRLPRTEGRLHYLDAGARGADLASDAGEVQIQQRERHMSGLVHYLDQATIWNEQGRSLLRSNVSQRVEYGYRIVVKALKELSDAARSGPIPQDKMLPRWDGL